MFLNCVKQFNNGMSHAFTICMNNLMFPTDTVVQETFHFITARTDITPPIEGSMT